MLAYILAVVVGLGSFSIYVAAFFFHEVHRKSDFWWSGVGLFYALILWTCAGRITGAVLLGQMASVSLLGWFGWQTLNLRRQVTPVAEQTKIPSKESTGKSFPKVGGKAKEESKTTPTETPAEVKETVTAKEETGQESTEAMEEISWETEVPTVAEMSSPNELETTETLKNLTQPTETETETKSELKTPDLEETTSQKEEVKSETKQDKAKDSSQKKAGGFSMLANNLKNLFTKKDKSKAKVKTTSKSVSEKVESTTETISETEPQARVSETKTVETEVNLTGKEEEGIAEVEINQTEETINTDGEAEQVTVVEKETTATVELNDSWEETETPEVTIIEEKVTVTTDEVKAEETGKEIESKEDDLKTEIEEPTSAGEAEKTEEESPKPPSVELKKSEKDSETEQ